MEKKERETLIIGGVSLLDRAEGNTTHVSARIMNILRPAS